MRCFLQWAGGLQVWTPLNFIPSTEERQLNEYLKSKLIGLPGRKKKIHALTGYFNLRSWFCATKAAGLATEEKTNTFVQVFRRCDVPESLRLPQWIPSLFSFVMGDGEIGNVFQQCCWSVVFFSPRRGRRRVILLFFSEENTQVWHKMGVVRSEKHCKSPAVASLNNLLTMEPAQRVEWESDPNQSVRLNYLATDCFRIAPSSVYQS